MSEEEKSELSTKCRLLKLKSKDGKFRVTDTLDTKEILRLQFKIDILLKESISKFPEILIGDFVIIPLFHLVAQIK